MWELPKLGVPSESNPALRCSDWFASYSAVYSGPGATCTLLVEPGVAGGKVGVPEVDGCDAAGEDCYHWHPF